MQQATTHLSCRPLRSSETAVSAYADAWHVFHVHAHPTDPYVGPYRMRHFERAYAHTRTTHTSPDPPPLAEPLKADKHADEGHLPPMPTAHVARAPRLPPPNLTRALATPSLRVREPRARRNRELLLRFRETRDRFLLWPTSKPWSRCRWRPPGRPTWQW